MAGNGRNGKFNKYVFAPGMLSATVPPRVAASVSILTVGRICTITGYEAAAAWELRPKSRIRASNR